MRSRTLVILVAVIGIVALAGAATASTADAVIDESHGSADLLHPHPPSESNQNETAETDSTTVENAPDYVAECAEPSPEDHADPDGDTSDVVGWVDGYWYDEPLDLEETLDEDDLESLVARTAARVEALRCHTFEEVPPIELLTRDEFREDVESQFEARDDAFWQFEDARLATLLIAGQATDAKELQIESQTAFPAAFYQTEEKFMGFITDDPDNLEVDQVTLAHELTHALQDQQFDLGQVFQEPTNDQYISSLAVAEGDAVLTDGMYEANCGTEWVDECLRPPAGDIPDIPNWAVALNQLAAYETPLVEETFESEGWDGVDELFAEMPDSTVEAIYPELYGEFERETLALEDESSDDWERLSVDGQAYTILGQQKFTSILLAPTLEAGVELVPIDEFVVDADPVTGEENWDYGISATDGWQSDRFVAYGNDDGETGGVLKVAWEDTDEAETFAAVYEDLIEFRGGELTEGYENVYTFDDSDEYEMALGIERTDDRLWIVTAPTVADLTAVYEPFEAVEDAGETDDETDTDGTDTETDADDDGPGFGVVIALATVTVLGLSARRVSRGDE